MSGPGALFHPCGPRARSSCHPSGLWAPLNSWSANPQLGRAAQIRAPAIQSAPPAGPDPCATSSPSWSPWHGWLRATDGYPSGPQTPSSDLHAPLIQGPGPTTHTVRSAGPNPRAMRPPQAQIRVPPIQPGAFLFPAENPKPYCLGEYHISLWCLLREEEKNARREREREKKKRERARARAPKW